MIPNLNNTTPHIDSLMNFTKMASMRHQTAVCCESKYIPKPDNTFKISGSDFCIYREFSSSSTPTIPKPLVWTTANANRLEELIIKFATGKIIKEEIAEQEKLQQLRRDASDTTLRSYDEIIQESKQKQLIDDLIKATKNYVQSKRTRTATILQR